jgi:hypothetical protein
MPMAIEMQCPLIDGCASAVPSPSTSEVDDDRPTTKTEIDSPVAQEKPPEDYLTSYREFAGVQNAPELTAWTDPVAEPASKLSNGIDEHFATMNPLREWRRASESIRQGGSYSVEADTIVFKAGGATLTLRKDSGGTIEIRGAAILVEAENVTSHANQTHTTTGHMVVSEASKFSDLLAKLVRINGQCVKINC